MSQLMSEPTSQLTSEPRRADPGLGSARLKSSRAELSLILNRAYFERAFSSYFQASFMLYKNNPTRRQKNEYKSNGQKLTNKLTK